MSWTVWKVALLRFAGFFTVSASFLKAPCSHFAKYLAHGGVGVYSNSQVVLEMVTSDRERFSVQFSGLSFLLTRLLMHVIEANARV